MGINFFTPVLLGSCPYSQMTLRVTLGSSKMLHYGLFIIFHICFCPPHEHCAVPHTNLRSQLRVLDRQGSSGYVHFPLKYSLKPVTGPKSGPACSLQCCLHPEILSIPGGHRFEALPAPSMHSCRSSVSSDLRACFAVISRGAACCVYI